MTVNKELKFKNILLKIFLNDLNLKNDFKPKIELLEYIDFNKIIESGEKVIDDSNLQLFFNFKKFLGDIQNIDQEIQKIASRRIEEKNYKDDDDFLLDDLSKKMVDKTKISSLLLDESFIESLCQHINYIVKNLDNLE